MQFALSLAISAMLVAGQLLKSRDKNDTGADDVAGNILVNGATALSAYGSGNETGFRKALRTIADGIYGFLGLPIAAPPDPK